MPAKNTRPFRMFGWIVAGGIGAALPLAGVMAGQPSTSLLDASGGQDWAGYGRTYGEQHFSPLAQINAGNVAGLKLASSFDLGPGASVTAPIAVGGVLYVAHRHSFIRAIDARTGRELWSHDTRAAEQAGRRMRVAWGSRGIAYWQGKVYTGTTDGRLIALDAKTGKQVWSQQTLAAKDTVRYITGAPRIFGDKVIIGHGGADSGTMRGYVTAYDARSGKQLWRFYTAPGQPGVDKDETTKIAAKSWAGEWWKYGGGGSVWNAITYDPATDTVFLGTGNGYPWNHRIRSDGKGDNLFLCSIVALDGKTGRYKWHYQINPGETWDYNASMDMELADLPINGQKRKVLMTAPKNGFFYVIDRLTGKLISAKPYVDKITWASGIDQTTGRPIENPEARFPDGKSFEMWPSFVGGHSWLPMAYSPATRLAYVPTIELGATYSDKGFDRATWRHTEGRAADVGLMAMLAVGDPAKHEQRSYLQAIDPATGKRVWQVPTPGPASGGVAATSGGLVFQGTIEGKFNAYAAATGKLVWSYNAGSAVLAPPIVYAIAGREYVSVITGNGTSFGTYSPLIANPSDYRTQGRHVLTFALGGKAKPPVQQASTLTPVADPDYRPDDALAMKGMGEFYGHCFVCHGFEAVGAGTAPDLRTSPAILDRAIFKTIVQGGGLKANGMPQFEELGEEQLEALRQYFRSKADLWRKAKP